MSMQNNHMKNRCYFIFIMCGLSLYSWYNYSLYEIPIDNSFSTPYYQNCLLMLFYLCWDIYKMVTNKLLFRADLMIHHVISLIVFVSLINYITLQLSNVLIMECISLMNYILRKHSKILKLYRILCICIVRLPLSLWFWYYYNPNIMAPIVKLSCTHYHYIYLLMLNNLYLFFIGYDFNILYKLYKLYK